MSEFVQSRRTEALLHAHDVIVRFGGRTGTWEAPEDVAEYVKKTKTPGQNFYGAFFYSSERARQVVRTAIEKELSDLLEGNSGPLGLSGPRLQRLANVRSEWSRK